MTKSKTDGYFLERNEGFSEVTDADDFLHPEQNASIKDPTLTETQFLGFSVPEANIHAYCYLWHHPNLHIVSGGLLVFQGIKDVQVEAELSDVRVYMNEDALAKDLHEFRLDNGYGVKVIDPMRRLHMTYSDPQRDNSVDVEITAVMPAFKFADGDHFDQPMRVKGSLVLRGKRYPVDCYHVRDRSWGRPRQEYLQPIPPLSWATAVFNDDFALHCSILDQAAHNPELKGTRFDLPVEKTLLSGWVQRDGKRGLVVSGSKRVVRDKRTFMPEIIEYSFTDNLGRNFDLKGTVVASCPYAIWPNLYFPCRLARWECDGMVAHGDLQEAIWNDYANFMRGR